MSSKKNLQALADTTARKNCENVQFSSVTKSLVECFATLDDVRTAILFITDNEQCDYGDLLADFNCAMREAENELMKIMSATMMHKLESTVFVEI